MGTGRLTEAEFQDQVTQYATLFGWDWYHTRDSRHSPDGFPDLVMAKPGRRVVYAELKAEDGRPTARQLYWLDLLGKAEGAEVYLWRPSDWKVIERVLGGQS